MSNEAFEEWKKERYPDGCIIKVLYGNGANIERPLEEAFNAGYKAKEAEPLPPIVQGLIDGQENRIKLLQELSIWRVDEPPQNKRIELLCVLFDEDEYRTLKKERMERRIQPVHCYRHLISTIDYKGKTEKECKAIAKQKYQSISNKTKTQPINKDGMKIECPMGGFRETTQHIADKKVLYALGEIDTLINNATFMFEEKNSDPRKTNTLNMLNYMVGRCQVKSE